MPKDPIGEGSIVERQGPRSSSRCFRGRAVVDGGISMLRGNSCGIFFVGFDKYRGG